MRLKHELAWIHGEDLVGLKYQYTKVKAEEMLS